MIRFVHHGFTELINKFGGAAELQRLVEASQKNWARDVVRQQLKGMGQYPPERPGQRYRRTGLLGDSWATRQVGPMQRSIYNDAPYAHWVVGDTWGRRQAWMHKGRWWVARQRILAQMPSLVRRIELRLKHFFEGTGPGVAEDLREYARSVTGETLKGPYAKP